MDVSKIFTALFLLTEVYSAHGSCNATEGFPNARSVKSMEGLAHFDDGFEIEYRCDDGFTLVSSDGISICQNGRWTSIECIQGCNGIPNADIYIVDKDGVMGKEPVTFVKHGQQVSIQCKEHFTLYKDGAFYDTDGTSSTCAVGSWSPAYSCKKDSCCLQVPDNGYLEINGARREDAIRIDSGFEGSIVCEEGFAFYDNDRQELFEHFPVTCLGHTLNASIPKCVKEPTCPKLEPVYNGVIYYQNDDVISLYHVAEIECNNGSDVFPEGTRFVTCVEGNTWDVNNITCERHLTISPPSHMKLYTGQGRYRPRITSSRRLKSRTSLHIECEYKHELVDGKTNKYYEVNSLQVRIFNGTVVPELPLCRKERCNLVADHCSFMDTDGNKLVGKVEHNTVVVKMCDPDFEFEPSYKRKEPSQRSTCNQGGISFPRCIPKRCEIPVDRLAKLYGRNVYAGDLIQNSQTVERTCSGKRELFYPETQIYEENFIFSSTCKIGVWSNGVFPICKEKRCNIVTDHCSFMDTDGNHLVGKVEHNTVVVKKCDPGFEFEPSDKRKEPNQKSTCDRGVIDFPRCIPKRCEIPHDRHARIGKDIYTADELVDSEEQVVVDCREREEVYYPESNTYAKTFTTTCISGLWSDDKFPICKEERCSSPNESDGTRFLLDEKVVQNGDKLEHGTILTKSCNKGYEDKTNLPTKCSSGSWINDEPCTGKPCTLPAIEHTRDNEIPKQLAHNGQVRVECKNGYDMIGSDVANQNIKTNCIKGNLAPSLDNIKCVPKEFYYDYPGVDEVKPEETCPNPANGRLVRSYLSYYNVVCDDGYELVVVENDDDYKCSNGKWMSKNFGFEAECNEKETRYGLEVKVGNSPWAGSWGELYVSILSEQGEIIHRMAFEKPDFAGLLRGQLYTLGSSTTGETRKVGKLKLLLGPGNRGINDDLEIDHIRLTIQRDADNTKKKYDFSSVGWLNKNQQKLVGPDTGVFRLKYRLGDAYGAGSGNTLQVSFEGNLGHTPFYLMSSGRRNGRQTYYKVIDGEYVGQIHEVTIKNDHYVKNGMQIDYIQLTVSHEDKEETYLFRNVGWIDSHRKEIQPEITADQPEMPSCQDDFDVSPGWVGGNLTHSQFTKAKHVKSDEDCKNLCRKDRSCKVAAVSGKKSGKKRLITCKIVYTDLKSAFESRGDGSIHRLYTRIC